MNIKTKSTLFATLIFANTIAVLSAVSMYLVKEDLREVIGAQQFTIARQEAEGIDEKFRLRVRALNAAAKHLAQRLGGRAQPERMQALLEDLPTLGEMFDDLFGFAADGAVTARMPFVPIPAGLTAADREYFQQTIHRRKGVISEPYLAKANKQPNVMITAPVLDAGGNVIAVLGGQLNLLKPNFLGELRQAKVGKTGMFALIGNDRTIVLSRDAERIMTKGPAAGSTRYLDRLVAGEDGWEEDVNSRGLHAVFGFKHLASVPWALVAALPVEEAFAPIAAAQKRIAIVTFSLALVLAPLVWLGVFRLLGPLIHLRNAARWIRGQPGKGLLLPVGTQDEIGDVAREFNELLKSKHETAAALVHAVNHDSLTGVASRALFLDRLQQAAVRSRRSGSLIALMYLDIDKFKAINDSRGHIAGDTLLREFAHRLQQNVRESDTVARLGGDEFVVLLDDLGGRRDALRVAEKILAAMRVPVIVGKAEIRITVSIGLSFASAADIDADELVRRADKALYEAKAAGRDTFRVAA